MDSFLASTDLETPQVKCSDKEEPFPLGRSIFRHIEEVTATTFRSMMNAKLCFHTSETCVTQTWQIWLQNIWTSKEMKPKFISSSINTFCNFLQTEIKCVTGRMQFLGGQRLTLDIGIVQLLYSGRTIISKGAFLGSTLEKYLQSEPSERSTCYQLFPWKQ